MNEWLKNADKFSCILMLFELFHILLFFNLLNAQKWKFMLILKWNLAIPSQMMPMTNKKCVYIPKKKQACLYREFQMNWFFKGIIKQDRWQGPWSRQNITVDHGNKGGRSTGRGKWRKRNFHSLVCHQKEQREGDSSEKGA